MAEFTSIAGALVALGRGANLPYFGKQTNIWPYSPREQKRKAIRGFPGVSDIHRKRKGAQFGLIEDEDSGNALGMTHHLISSGRLSRRRASQHMS